MVSYGNWLQVFCIKTRTKSWSKRIRQKSIHRRSTTVAVGDKSLVEELINQIRMGPSHAHVKNCRVEWSESIEEFNAFEVRS